MIVHLTQTASKSFIKDLRANNIPFTFKVGFTTIEVVDSPKVRMAIQMVKERFVNGIKVEIS